MGHYAIDQLLQHQAARRYDGCVQRFTRLSTGSTAAARRTNQNFDGMYTQTTEYSFKNAANLPKKMGHPNLTFKLSHALLEALFAATSLYVHSRWHERFR